MIKVDQSPQSCRIRMGRLRLTYRYVVDRWRHEVELGDSAGWQRLITSREGQPDDAVPPSPVFQALRLEWPGDDYCEVQLFGQAGGGAYSAAVRVDAGSRTIDFDVCARRERLG